MRRTAWRRQPLRSAAASRRRRGGFGCGREAALCVTVLRDDRSDALGASHGEPEADRGAVVEDIDGEALESDDLGKALDDAGDAVERIAELTARWHSRLT